MQRSLIATLGALMMVAASASFMPAVADAEEKASDPRNRIICRRFPRTGSLADSYRVCKTRWEWERERDNVQQLGRVYSCRDASNPECAHR